MINSSSDALCDLEKQYGTLMVKIRKNEDGLYVVKPDEDWLRVIRKIAEKENAFTCPKCGGNVTLEQLN